MIISKHTGLTFISETLPLPSWSRRWQGENMWLTDRWDFCLVTCPLSTKENTQWMIVCCEVRGFESDLRPMWNLHILPNATLNMAFLSTILPFSKNITSSLFFRGKWDWLEMCPAIGWATSPPCIPPLTRSQLRWVAGELEPKCYRKLIDGFYIGSRVAFLPK